MSTTYPFQAPYPGRRGPRGRGMPPWAMAATEESSDREPRDTRRPERRGPERGGERHERGRRGRRGGWPGGRRGPQAARGDVRAAILALLAEEPMHGYQIIGEIAERSDGAWRPSPGSVYPTLAQLEDEGLVSADAESGKRVFTLTDAGRSHVASLPTDTPPPWQAYADSDRHQLRDLVRQLGAAVVQVDEAGTAAQRSRTAELLTETRRAVYRLLADDDPTAS